MINIQEIRQFFIDGKIELSSHAFKRAIERKIYFFEIEEAGSNAIIIEEYPEDKYSPSALLLGFSNGNKVLHLQVTTNNLEYLKIITVYEPNEDKFVDLSIRR
jgi:hypothetical protein